MAWLSGWTFRKAIVIAHTADGAQTNYQLKLLVGESSGATGEDVDCGAKVASDFDDLRFTTSDGSTLCDYWIESLSGSTPNQLATVWIEVPSIAAHPDDTTIYMYYGNSGASAYSSGASTFPFFDDFNRGDNATVGNSWTELENNGGTAAISSNTLVCTSNTSASEYGYVTKAYTIPASTTVMLEGRCKQNATDKQYGLLGISSNNTRTSRIYYTNTGKFNYYNGSSFVAFDTDTSYSADTYNILGISTTLGGTKSSYYIDRVLKSATEDNWGYADGDRIEFGAVTAAAYTDTMDWVLVRVITTNEPTWSSFGAEESFYLNRLSPYVHILAH